MNPDDARNFIMALNGIAAYVPPIQMAQLTGNPVAMMLQAVANGQLKLAPEPMSGEAGPPRPHLVKPDDAASSSGP